MCPIRQWSRRSLTCNASSYYVIRLNLVSSLVGADILECFQGNLSTAILFISAIQKHCSSKVLQAWWRQTGFLVQLQMWLVFVFLIVSMFFLWRWVYGTSHAKYSKKYLFHLVKIVSYNLNTWGLNMINSGPFSELVE